MKTKITIKALKELASSLNAVPIRLGYCELQELFNRSDVNFYTCGVYGWNFDAFIIHFIDDQGYIRTLLITTGYRNMFGYRPSWELIEKTENDIRARVKSRDDIRNDFLKAVYKEVTR